MLAVSFALSHKMEVTCDAPLAATAPFRRRPEHVVNERQGEGGSQAEVPARPRHVRFAPESRHCSAPLACPLSARKRHMQCSKPRCYSIRSSARCWRNPAYLAAWIARNEMRVPATSHGRTPSDRSVAAQLMNSTLVPLWTILLSACASQLVRWTQPWDTLLPTLSGAGVPWIP
jgi:hypothetical protein